MENTFFKKIHKVVKERMSIDQLILFYIYSKKTLPTTINELAKELEMPRTTIVEHLRALKIDGFIEEEKDGKTKKYYPVPDIASEFLTALSDLSSAYIYALDHIRKSELKDIKEAFKDKK